MKKKIKESITFWCGVAGSIAGACGAIDDIVRRFIVKGGAVHYAYVPSTTLHGYKKFDASLRGGGYASALPENIRSWWWLVLALFVLAAGIAGMYISKRRERMEKINQERRQ